MYNKSSNKSDSNIDIRKIEDTYDKLLPFNRYLNNIFNEYNFDDDISFKICCPLHEEKTPSFSYSHNLNVWTCFGACHTTGKTCKFHFLWLRKQYGNKVTRLWALRDLQKRFPHVLPPIESVLGTNTTQYRTNNKVSLYDELSSKFNKAQKIKTNTKIKVVQGDLTIDEELLRLFIKRR